MFRHKPHRRRRPCCRVNLLSAGYKAQLINQSLFALRCAETTDGTDNFSGAAAPGSCWIHSKRRGFRKSSSKNLCRGITDLRDSSCTKRPTSDKWYKENVFIWELWHSEAVLHHHQPHMTGLLFSVDVCVPAFIKPNISLPLNHVKLFLLINLHKYLSVSTMIRLLTNKVDLLWTFTDSPVLTWPIQIPFFNLSRLLI